MIEEQLVQRLRTAVSARLAERDEADEAAHRPRLDPKAQRLYGRELISQEIEAHARERLTAGLAPLPEHDEDELVQAVYDSLFGLGRLEAYLADDSVENILANGYDQVWVIRSDGTKERGRSIAESDTELVELMKTAAARMGRSERRFDLGQPHLNLRLPDGSRLFAVMEVSGRPSIAIRRHRHTKVDLADLVGLGTIDRTLESFFTAAVRARRNIVVAGGTDVGKTTFLRALLAAVPPQERLVVIEDEAELNLAADVGRHEDVVELEKREANVEGEGEIAMADLTRMALRMAPERVIVGEVRGGEVVPMLLAMSQGNDGSMCTVHSDSSAGAFSRLAMYALMAREQLRMEATSLLLAQSLHLVVHLRKLPGGARVVSSVREVVGSDGQTVQSNEIFAPGPDGRAVPATPMRDSTADLLRRAGFDDSLLHRSDGWWS